MQFRRSFIYREYSNYFHSFEKKILGMALYSLSCSIYSTAIEKLVKRFRAKPVYIGGQLVYSIGMIFMAIARSTWGVILFSWSAGIMYSTLFTMPYLIVAHYHETDCVSIKF